MNDAEMSQARSEYLNCTYGVPWVPEDDRIAQGIYGAGDDGNPDDHPPTYEEDPSFYDDEKPMSLEEEVGYPVTEEEYLQAEYDDQEVWPLYDDDPNLYP